MNEGHPLVRRRVRRRDHAPGFRQHRFLAGLQLRAVMAVFFLLVRVVLDGPVGDHVAPNRCGVVAADRAERLRPEPEPAREHLVRGELFGESRIPSRKLDCGFG